MTLIDSSPARTAEPVSPEIAQLREDYAGGLGGLGLFGARLYLVILPMLLLNALFQSDLPANIVFVMPAVGFLLVTPRRRLLRMPISPALIVFCLWVALSYLWTIDRTRTLFLIREDLAPIVGAVIVFGLLPTEESLKWFVRGMKLMLAVAVAVLILDPETQSLVLEGEEKTGWGAWFGSKNELGRSALVAMMTLLYLDKTNTTRIIGMVTAIVLILGSSSATGLAGAMFAFGVWVWGMQFRKLRREWSGTFIISSTITGILVLVAAFASAAYLVGLLGRDLSFSGRTDVWTPSLDFIEARPWLGYGYRAMFGSETVETFEIWRTMGFRASHAHNGPLETVLGLGLVGLVLFFFVYFSVFSAALRLLREYDVALYAFAFCLVMLPVAIVEPVFQSDWLGMLVICQMLLMRVRLDERGAHDPGGGLG